VDSWAIAARRDLRPAPSTLFACVALAPPASPRGRALLPILEQPSPDRIGTLTSVMRLTSVTCPTNSHDKDTRVPFFNIALHPVISSARTFGEFCDAAARLATTDERTQQRLPVPFSARKITGGAKIRYMTPVFGGGARAQPHAGPGWSMPQRQIDDSPPPRKPKDGRRTHTSSRDGFLRCGKYPLFLKCCVNAYAC